MRTPTTCYKIPILEVLYDLGGGAYRLDVIDRVRVRLKNILTDHDYTIRPGYSQRVYERSADSARQRLAERGLLKSDSARGVWELTPAGVAEVLRIRHD